MKQEFERHGYKMQVQALKYDPLNVYISDIKITIIRPIVGVSDFEDTGVEGKPIQSYGGFNGLNTLRDVAVVESYPFDSDFLQLPQRLIQTVRDDKLFISKLLDDKKMETMIAEGKHKYGHLGIGFRRFDKEEVKMQSGLNSHLSVKSDGSLSVDNAVRFTEIFINNEPASHEAVRLRMIDQLYTVVSILGTDSSGQKRSGVTYLLFYFNEDN